MTFGDEVSDIEISNGGKPRAKFDLDPLEWFMILITLIVCFYISKL